MKLRDSNEICFTYIHPVTPISERGRQRQIIPTYYGPDTTLLLHLHSSNVAGALHITPF